MWRDIPRAASLQNSSDMNRAMSLLVLTVFTLGLGCSRQTAVYSDPAVPGAVNPSTDNSTLLPGDFANQSVNRASVEKHLDGVSATSKAIRFQTSSGSNSVGAFNGPGTGNRAINGV